jgi:hypothetical protein
MAPPTGLTIGSTTKPYTIGRILGSGACGSVHELIAPAGSKHTDYAIKLAPLPKSKPANGKKRKKTAEEKNADLISYEHLTLRNLGVEVRGRLVPDIPFVGPPAYGEIEGEFSCDVFYAKTDVRPWYSCQSLLCSLKLFPHS